MRYGISKKGVLSMFIVFLCLSVTVLIGVGVIHTDAAVHAFAETSMDIFSEEINATFLATRLNDTECSVCIDNKNEATRAIVPSFIQIDGKDYEVTEIDLNGFMGSPNLKRVSLAVTVKKIGNSAFANCPQLSIVFMPGVKEIGNYAFMKCPELKSITIPGADITLGAMLFRNNDTQVIVRATEPGVNWHASWNRSNANQNVIYQVNHRDNLVLEPLYSVQTRSSEPVGYSVAIGQPFVGDFYSEMEGNTIYIPAVNPNDGKPVMSIEMEAFSGNTCNNLIVEYSDLPIYIDTYAFSKLEAINVYINRPIIYLESIDYTDNAENIFYQSTVQKVALPDSIPGIAAGMFYDCTNLNQVSFITPQDGSREEQKNILDNLQNESEVKTPNKESFTYIRKLAFNGTTNIPKLTITRNVQDVGANIVKNWETSQQICLDFICDRLPAFNSETNTGWNKSWYGNYDSSKVEYTCYLLMFNANNGAVDVDEKEVKLGEEIGQLPEPRLAGAFFAGWYDSNNNLFTANKIYSNKANTELFAKWQCQITYVIDGKEEKYSYDRDSNITLKNFDKEGFNGYFRDSNNIKHNFGDKYYLTKSNQFVVYYDEKPLEECVKIESGYNTYYYAVYGPQQLRELANLSTTREIRLMNDIDATDKDWQPFELGTYFNGKGKTITFKNESVNGNQDFGFFSEITNIGRIESTKFKAKIKTTQGNSEGHYVGVIAAKIQSTANYIKNCTVLSCAESPFYNNKNNNSVDVLVLNPNTKVGGLVGRNWGSIEECYNYASIAACGTIGGIVGENYWCVNYCANRGSIFFDHNGVNNAVGGIAGIHYCNSYMNFNKNYGNITLANVSTVDTNNKGVAMGQIIGYHKYLYGKPMTNGNQCLGVVSSNGITSINTSYICDAEAGYIQSNT